MKKEKKFRLFGQDSWQEILLCGAAATLFPTVIMLYFCAQNVTTLILPIAAVMTAWLIFLAAAVYLLGVLILRRGFLSLLFCTFCWLGCYLQPVIDKAIPKSIISHRLTLVSAVIFATASCLVMLLRKTEGARAMKIERLFTAILSVMLVLNIGTLVHAAVQNARREQLSEIPHKTDFFVSEDAETPNIYWIHPDGMLGFDTIEKYFGDSQQEFRLALSERGFALNGSASFEVGHHTISAIPALTCPYTYDNWMKELMPDHKRAVEARQDYGINQMFAELRKKTELQSAFYKKGYASNVISIPGYYYPVADGDFYPLSDEILSYTGKRTLIHYDAEGVVKLYTNLGTDSALIQLNDYFSNYIFEWARDFGTEYLAHNMLDNGKAEPYRTCMTEKELRKILLDGWNYEKWGNGWIDALYEMLNAHYTSPCFTIIHDMNSHGGFFFDENGNKTGVADGNNPLNYLPQHKWSAKVLVNTVDMILSADPDAVIVIQADHGMHMCTEEDFKAAFGEDADPIELWNSTMSAIRVPEKYRTGEEHYAMENPLNISRYLVNSFVGKNYDYLPPN